MRIGGGVIFRVRQAADSDRDELVAMRMLLWPESSTEEQLGEVDRALATGMSGTLPGVILVAAIANRTADEQLIGFVEAGLRSHADGCDTAQPVGFVEGWFVSEAHRNQGVGRHLMGALEDWAREHGCIELASDALISEEGSLHAHSALGFEVVDRCVHFRKSL
jgi:aminoglycoside 6'-N-acetyltransferase I